MGFNMSKSMKDNTTKDFVIQYLLFTIRCVFCIHLICFNRRVVVDSGLTKKNIGMIVLCIYHSTFHNSYLGVMTQTIEVTIIYY